MTNRISLVLGLLTATLGTISVPFVPLAHAQAVPTTMNFQGRLAKPDGTPVADTTTQTLTFRLYNALTSGTKLWEQTFTSNVAVRNGTFAVSLNFGSGFTSGNTLTSVFGAANAPYLEIVVGTTSLTPRQSLNSVPYSLNANNAITANTALSVPDGSITTSKFAAGVLNFSNVTGQITGSQIAPGTITTSNLTDTLQRTLAGFDYGFPLLLSIPVPSATSNYIATDGTDLFVAGNHSLTVFDPNSVFSTFAPIGSANLTSTATATGIALSGHTVVVAQSLSTNGGIQLVDVTNPATPVVKGSVQTLTGNTPTAVAASGNYAYLVSSSANNFQVINISNTAAPALVAGLGVNANPNSVAISGNYAYITCRGANTMQVINITTPTSPSLIKTVATGAAPNSVMIANGYAYVTNATDSTLQIFDLTAPANPILKSTIALPSQPYNSAAYLSSLAVLTSNGVYYVDVTNATAPVLHGVSYVSGYTNLVQCASYFAAAGYNTLNFTGIYPAPLYNFFESFGNSVYVQNTLTATNLNVSNNALIGYLTVLNTTSLGDTTIGGTLSVAKDTTLSGKATVSGLLTASAGTSLNTLFASGAATFNSSVSVAGNETVTGTLGVLSATTLNGTLNVSNGTTLGSTLGVTGATTLSTLNVTGATTLNGVSVGGNETVTGTLGVSGATSLNNGLGVVGGIVVDKNGAGTGTLANGIILGGASGEGIVSRRTSGTNQNGLDFLTASTPRLSVANGGNVGINTQTPASTLDVNGTTAVRGDLRMIQRGGGAGNNSGQGRALVDAGNNTAGVGTGLYINFANDFGYVTVASSMNVTGNLLVNGTVTQNSDRRFKKNIVSLENPLDAILNLRGVSYEWRKDEFRERGFGDGKQIGFIAQEIEKIFPELVFTNANGYKSVNYIGVVPVAVEAIKTLNVKVETLEAKNAILEARLAAIEKLLRKK